MFKQIRNYIYYRVLKLLYYAFLSQNTTTLLMKVSITLHYLYTFEAITNYVNSMDNI